MTHFEVLKKEVVVAFHKTHPHCAPEMSEWKGQEIVDFQEELMSKVKGRLSEKWFYTHIKAPSDKLPRIDMLNMLSEYAGFKNWNDFVGTKFPAASEPSISVPSVTGTDVPKKKSRSRTPFYMAVLVLVTVVSVYVFSPKTHTYKCCFVDINGFTPLTGKVRILVLREGESPVYAETTEGGCLELNESHSKIKFVIATPYFRPDTFIRILEGEITQDRIQPKTDDYALMIHYFSKSNIKDWKTRRSQLNDMIAENAKVFQVYADNTGMELFNKKEFIDKLTMPLKSLKNVEILDVAYQGNKIIELRFRQTENK